jgi:hypothetical protein
VRVTPAQANPAGPGGGVVCTDTQQAGRPVGAEPVDTAAAGVGERADAVRGGAQIGIFQRIVLSGGSEGDVIAVGHTPHPRAAGIERTVGLAGRGFRQGERPHGTVWRSNLRGYGSGARNGAALHDQVLVFDACGQAILVQLRLAHQPVGDAAQEFGLRAAALVAAAPEPDLVRHQHGDTALVDVAQHQQRRAGKAGHQHLAGDTFGADGAIPTAPARRCRALIGAGEASGDRVAGTQGGDKRPEFAGENAVAGGGGVGGQHVGQRGLVEAVLAGEFGAGGEQQGAAVADVVGDVAQIDVRQNAAVGEAVEDDEVETGQLFLEQLAGREGDERQLVERRHVVALGGAQDGEVDQIHGGIGFEQAAPGAFVQGGFAGDEQDAEAVAHAVDLYDGAVVQGRGLAGGRVGGEFENGGAGAGNVHRNGLHLADRDGLRLWRGAVAAERERGGAAGRALAEILDDDAERKGAADDAVAGGFQNAHPSVPFLAFGGEQGVQRDGRGRLRQVVHLAVGDGGDAGEAVGRDVGEGALGFGPELGAFGAALGDADLAQLEVRHAGGLGAQAGGGGVGKVGTVADLHGGGAVHHHQEDVAQALAGFAHEGGAGEPGEQDGIRGCAQPAAAGAAPDREAGGADAERGEQGQQRNGQAGREAEGGEGLGHAGLLCPGEWGRGQCKRNRGARAAVNPRPSGAGALAFPFARGACFLARKALEGGMPKVDVAQLTEQQRKWFASVRDGLQRETGKSLAEWVAIAKTCPETGHRARLRWFKETHGLLQNRASYVLGEAFPPEVGWDDAGALRDALWVDAGSRAILEAVERVALALPDVIAGQRKGFSAWSRKHQFAAVRPMKGGKARLGLAVPVSADARLEAAKNEGWSERLKASMMIGGVREIDARVKELVKAAWDAS